VVNGEEKVMFDPDKNPELPNSERLPELTGVTREQFETAARSLALYSESDEEEDFDAQNPAELEHGTVSSDQYLNIRTILAFLGRD
jgi:hypothetical protein